MKKVVIIGGGASGMLAAYGASITGKEVILLEKNEKLGKKIYITGKGRCNLTANVPTDEFFLSVVSNPKFTFSSVNNFTPQHIIELLESNGLKLKTERGDRVFPFSDKASDVTKTLEKLLVSNGVDIRLNTTVSNILYTENGVSGVQTDKGTINCDSVIICTGGCSYPTTGSTGDGYQFAKKVGHTIVDLKPSLVGVELNGSDFLAMQGLSLKNVNITVKSGDKTIFTDFGEMLFTHFGVSGPIILSCSAKINRMDLSKIVLSIDLKPALDFNTLDKRLLREFKENNVKTVGAVMRGLIPKTLIECVLNRAKVNQNKNCSEITSLERLNIIKSLKNLDFTVKRLRPLEEAIVTAGGVNVKEINPKTMESKLVKGLFFAGEVLDIDAYTGGYNLQLAFSTGYAAGCNS